MGDESGALRALSVFDNRFSQSTLCDLALWAAVFKQGVADYAETLRYENDESKGRHTVLTDDRDEVKRWFNSNAVYPGSFAWLCEVFDQDVAYTRQYIRSGWRELHLPKSRTGKRNEITEVLEE